MIVVHTKDGKRLRTDSYGYREAVALLGDEGNVLDFVTADRSTSFPSQRTAVPVRNIAAITSEEVA